MNHVRFHSFRLLVLSAFAGSGLAVASSGCGTVQEGTEEDWTSTPPFSATARLEYRVDSLMNENRKLQQQHEAVAAENRNLLARNTELEARIKEAATTPQSNITTPVTSPRVSGGAPPGGYEEAMQKYRTRRYQEAADHFGSLINTGISDDLLDNCYYWIGESYFAMRRFNEAIQQFEIVAGMSSSDKADDAQYMIGNSYYQMGRTDNARAAFQKLIQLYPSSPLVKRARAKMPSL